MATTQKKSGTTTRKKTSGTKKAAPKRSAKKRPYRREIGGGFCVLAALCTLISYFQGEGWLIRLLPAFFKGLTGYGYYLWAPCLAIAAWILLTHKGRPVALRTTCALLMPVFAGGIGHLVQYKATLETAVGVLPLLWKSGKLLTSGGVVSGLMAQGIRAVFGQVVAMVLLIVLEVVLFTIVFHRLIGLLFEAWKNRERLEYEYEPEEEEEPVPVRTRGSDKPRVSINIPLDDEPKEKRPGVLSGFFRQKSKDQQTPDQLLREAGRKEPVDITDAAVEVEDYPTLSSPQPKRTAFQPERTSAVEEPAPIPTPNSAPTPTPPPAVHSPAPAPAAEPVAPAASAVEEPLAAAEPSRRSKKEEARAEMEHAAAEVSAEIDSSIAQASGTYTYPPITLLEQSGDANHMEAGAELRSNAQRLADTLTSFGVDAAPGDVIRGPAITRYEFVLEQGVKLSKITNLADDIALALGASGVRIAPVPDKISVVGIEVPNKHVSPVLIRDVLESQAFTKHKSCVAFSVGRDIANQDIVGDIAKLPHVLIAGTTGSGKSVCTNSLIISLLYKSTPEEVRFIMVDPKMVELAPYNGIPHLLIPVVTDPKKAAGALQWAVFEMMKRYKTFSELGVKKLEEYNALAAQREELKKMATVVVVIDELADLMLVAAKEVEESICRVAQMGRAAGIHLVIATQRPSADVITGLMKANIPSRIAFAVASSLESRIILDTPGAEKLVGRGDMLYAPLGEGKPRRVQGCFISPEEIERVVAFVKQSGEAEYSDEVMQKIEEAMAEKEKGSGKKDRYDGSTTAAVEEMEGDELFPAAVEVVLETGMASVSMLQRRLKLGYSRAARLVDQMEERGVVGPFEGSKPRQVLITKEQWQELQMKKSGVAAVLPELDADDAPWDGEE